ncbi:hypothetical protein GR243_38110 [Rhizobium leguminosarum]|nr:hypothetical protein [Rhizobium leguminosarum]
MAGSSSPTSAMAKSIQERAITTMRMMLGDDAGNAGVSPNVWGLSWRLIRAGGRDAGCLSRGALSFGVSEP